MASGPKLPAYFCQKLSLALNIYSYGPHECASRRGSGDKAWPFWLTHSGFASRIFILRLNTHSSVCNALRPNQFIPKFCWDSPCVLFGLSLEMLILIVRPNTVSQRTKVATSSVGTVLNYNAVEYSLWGSATFWVVSCSLNSLFPKPASLPARTMLQGSVKQLISKRIQSWTLRY